MYTNDNTVKVKVGNTYIGGGAPISVQSMLCVPVHDIKGNVEQALHLEKAGCDIVRVTVPNKEALQTVKALKESDIPIFFIHGKKDGFVPCEMTEESYKAAAAEKYICLVDDADHGISFLVDTDNIQKQITEFVNAHRS